MSPNKESACAERCARGCRCLLYPTELRLLGGFFMFFAGILLLAFGMSYLLPYTQTLDFKTATCTTLRVSVPGPSEMSTCRCYDDDAKCYGNLLESDTDAQLVGQFGHKVMDTPMSSGARSRT